MHSAHALSICSSANGSRGDELRLSVQKVQELNEKTESGEASSEQLSEPSDS